MEERLEAVERIRDEALTTVSPTPAELLLAWSRGERDAFDQLIPLVHNELHRLARYYMRGERPDHTLQATALVNEAYIRLVEVNRISWQNREHFLAMAARMMRRVLVDFERARRSRKRGAGVRLAAMREAYRVPTTAGHDLAALDDALQHLQAVHPRKSRVVELRFFGGLSVEETAEALQVSRDTVKRDWRFAKMWLLRELGNGPRQPSLR
jgi:RNA polymerase sigma factor (TIGR02999 family)